MKKILFVLFCEIFMLQNSMAAQQVSVEDIIKSSFKNATEIQAKQLVLSKVQYEQIKKFSNASVATKVYRYYAIYADKEIIGYGVLITRKVRSKNATVLYAFSNDGALQFSEILFFGEPPEYIPNKIWMDQFKDVTSLAPLTLGEDIPTISGATLSARSISDGARIARAIYTTVLKK